VQFWLLHASQEKPLFVPEQVPARYWLDPQVMLEHVLQLNPLLVPEQLPALYWFEGQFALLQTEHKVLAVPAHPLRAYCPVLQPRHGVHVVSKAPVQPPLRN